MKHTRQLKDVAVALAASAMDLAELKTILSNLKIIQAALEQNSELVSRLSEKSIKLEERQQLLRNISQNQISSSIINALLILQQENVLREFKEFIALVFRAAEEKDRLFTANVTSALPLEVKERDELAKLLQKKFPERALMFEEKVDPRILGGLTVAVGDLKFDASLKGKIKQLAHQLAATQ
jgi:F-type H+-transporting ATPase subunit delta